jgi:hypothetical protein
LVLWVPDWGFGVGFVSFPLSECGIWAQCAGEEGFGGELKFYVGSAVLVSKDAILVGEDDVWRVLGVEGVEYVVGAENTIPVSHRNDGENRVGRWCVG